MTVVLPTWIVILAMLLSILEASSVREPPQVHTDVYRTLRKQATVNLMVTMREDTLAALTEAFEFNSTRVIDSQPLSRGARITQLVSVLKTAAAKALRPVTKILAEEAAFAAQPLFSSSTTFWISNQIFIVNASMELLLKLTKEPSINEIHEENILTMGNNFEAEVVDASTAVEMDLIAKNEAWGIRIIGATTLWTQGITGHNVTVATIDSGVRLTHEALRDSFVGDNGWYDPELKRETPYDESGHGTHVTGLIAGKGIGVAPGAKWMSCRGCSSLTSCRESSLLACAQFMLCPTDVRGKNKDCSKAPHVVNNSWGIVRGSVDFTAVIAAWRAAGIVPIFSAGNSGSPEKCSTVVSPADGNSVIGVGASSSDDSLLPQSATGPSPQGRIKPDIVAPGVRVYSAWWTRDNVYAITSGTSMAAPHVAGAVALLLSAKPELTYEEIWTALTNTAAKEPSIVNSALVHGACGNTSATTFPNNIFGYGRLNVERALSTIQPVGWRKNSSFRETHMKP